MLNPLTVALLSLASQFLVEVFLNKGMIKIQKQF